MQQWLYIKLTFPEGLSHGSYRFVHQIGIFFVGNTSSSSRLTKDSYNSSITGDSWQAMNHGSSLSSFVLSLHDQDELLSMNLN